jgi:hypothetical protein
VAGGCTWVVVAIPDLVAGVVYDVLRKGFWPVWGRTSGTAAAIFPAGCAVGGVGSLAYLY